mmetsp:Transcript_14781/g.36846  ORF Transcript_14781/g.36846 Transcript_14781/m.36846 type:complete len:725 (+) Transcript_14781:295-2469(+)
MLNGHPWLLSRRARSLFFWRPPALHGQQIARRGDEKKTIKKKFGDLGSGGRAISSPACKNTETSSSTTSPRAPGGPLSGSSGNEQASETSRTYLAPPPARPLGPPAIVGPPKGTVQRGGGTTGRGSTSRARARARQEVLDYNDKLLSQASRSPRSQAICSTGVLPPDEILDSDEEEEEEKLLGIRTRSRSVDSSDEHEDETLFMDGAFDLTHYGHYNALRLAKSLGKRLVVGVNSSGSVHESKGFAPVLTDEERCIAVEGCRFVDEIIPKSPYVMTKEYMLSLIDSHHIDYFVHGSDPCIVDGVDVYDTARAMGRFRMVPRTRGISTTDIVGRMLLYGQTQGALVSPNTARTAEPAAAPATRTNGGATATAENASGVRPTVVTGAASAATSSTSRRGHLDGGGPASASTTKGAASEKSGPKTSFSAPSTPSRSASKTPRDREQEAPCSRASLWMAATGPGDPGSSPAPAGSSTGSSSCVPTSSSASTSSSSTTATSAASGGGWLPSKQVPAASSWSSSSEDVISGRGADHGEQTESREKLQERGSAMMRLQSRFYSTSGLLRSFSEHCRPPEPGQRIVYFSDSWDMFCATHILAMREAREKGDYLLIGIYSDALIDELECEPPVLTFYERTLSVLGCKYTSDILLPAPAAITDSFLQEFDISLVCVMESTNHHLPDGKDALSVPVCELKPRNALNKMAVLSRVFENHEAFRTKYEKKIVTELNY